MADSVVWGIASTLRRISRPVRDPKYLKFIRDFPCVGCGTTRRQRDAMHTGPHGLGQKASDLDALPGCRECHRQLHQIGPVKFQERHKITFADLIVMFQQFYRLQFPERHQEIAPQVEAETAKKEAA